MLKRRTMTMIPMMYMVLLFICVIVVSCRN